MVRGRICHIIAFNRQAVKVDVVGIKQAAGEADRTLIRLGNVAEFLRSADFRVILIDNSARLRINELRLGNFSQKG